MPLQFAGTLFLSALLLFCVQPLIAKMILPLLGGAPAVWNTCMVFFQTALLAGYLYSHGVTRWVGPRGQVLVHLVVLVLPLGFLPISVVGVAGVPAGTSPVLSQLGLMASSVGLPFFVVATSAPLLQKWFADSGHASAGDPYFLYVASNLGSMVALLGYPFVLEPQLSLGTQAHAWRAGYVLLVLGIAWCGVRMVSARRAARRQPAEAAIEAATAGEPSDAALTPSRRCRWVALACVPSALLLAVTAYLTTDVAALPLLWVVPLATYLLTFILAFARRPWLPRAWCVAVLPITTLVVLCAFLANVALVSWVMMPVHVLVLFLAALTCHGMLAQDRPAARHLTEFYLWLSVGGVLGGLCAALLAPWLFQNGILEYPLALIAACLLLPGPRFWTSTSVQRWLDLLPPLGISALTLVLVLLLRIWQARPTLADTAVVLGILAVACVLQASRPARFALALLALVLTFAAANPSGTRTRFVERNFFGVVRVQDDADRGQRILTHGTTLHGLQRLPTHPVVVAGYLAPWAAASGWDAMVQFGILDPVSQERRVEPLSYFTRTGPIGQIFDVFNLRLHQDKSLPPRVAITGLGVGALASYAQPGQAWTYYEIDPAIIRVARPEAGLFTFLASCRTPHWEIIPGDARLQMQLAPPHGYGLIVLDAFSSDAVPMHLISREALELYLAKLAPHGLLAFNITNRYLDLKPVLANLAAAADPPLLAYGRDDLELTAEDIQTGKTGSQWVVLACRERDLGVLLEDDRWHRLVSKPGTRVWTDDFSNLLEAIKFGR